MYYRDPTSNLGFLPIHKNASTTFSHLVQRAGWIREEGPPTPKTILWGHIQNPWIRYKKGMAQIAWLNNERSFDAVSKLPFFKMAFLNPHLLPISITYPALCDNMHLIPMDAEHRDCNDLTNEFLSQNDSSLRITLLDTKHKADARKIAYQKEVDNWMETNYPYKKMVLQLHQHDFDLWRYSLAPHEDNPHVETWFQKSLKRIWTSA